MAIVGLGGTGSYILDFLAKTPVQHIHLFDGDRFLQHNAFRSPGAPSLEELQEELSKVGWFQRIYSRMRGEMERIWLETGTPGVRVFVTGTVGGAEIDFSVDITFGPPPRPDPVFGAIPTASGGWSRT